MRSRIPAATALAATLVLATSAEAFEVKHATGGELVRWRRPGVTWTVDPSVEEIAGAEDAVSAALAAWSRQSGAPALSLAAKGAKLKPGLDGANGIFFVKNGYAPAGSALAVTVLSFDDRTGEVLDADIVMNGKYELGTIDAELPAPTKTDDPGAQTYDVGRVLAHEMGHALALSDEPEREDALMYPYVARGLALRAAPGVDDLAGIETLYATGAETEQAGSGAAGAGGCSGASRRPAPAGTWCALGLGVGAVVLVRKRRAAAGLAGLAAVVVLGPGSANASTTEPESIVTEVRTTVTDGLFQSEVTVTTDGMTVSRHAVWGGTARGVRQIIGGTLLPRAGERVRIVVASRASGEASVARLVHPSAH